MRRNLAWRAFIAVAAVLIASITVPGVAKADVPSSDWTVALPRASQIFTNPSGGVLAIIRAANEPDAQSRVQQVTAAGDLGWKTDIAAGLTVTPDPVFDGFGNVYWGEEGQDGSWVTAKSSTGASLWRVAMPESWINYRLTVGLNGDLYALGATNCCQESLLRIAPETGALSTPVPVPGTITGCCTDLYAYKGGLIAAGSEVVYMDYDGQISHHYSLPNGNIFKVFASNADGEVFAGVSPDGPGGSCNYGEGRISISKYNPTDGQVWNYLAPSAYHCNIGFLRLAALPSGGVAATFGSDGIDGHGLTTLSPDGKVLWSKTPQPAGSDTSVGDIFQIQADTAGHIIVLESLSFLCRSGAEVCGGMQLEYYSQDDGSKAQASDVFQEPDPTPGLYSPAAQPNSFAIDAGRVFLALQHTNGTPLTATESPDYPLVALSASKLTGQYPSSVLLDQMPSAEEPQPAVNATLTLDPANDSSPINVTHVLTALFEVNGSPMSEATVEFAVTSGPCVGKSASGSTDDTGTTAWGYACDSKGTDSITVTARVFDGTGGSLKVSASATTTWTVPDTYVALGDSFSAGEGVPTKAGYLSGTDVTDNHCHRSYGAYPSILSKTSGAPTKFQFSACSGALIQDFFTPFATNHRDDKGSPVNSGEAHSQLSHLNGSTQLITLTVGGNNAFFADVLDYCSKKGLLQASCQSVYEGSVDSAIHNMAIGTGSSEDDLPDLYAAIRRKAPNAKVLVLGYPHFFPAKRFTHCGTGVPSRMFAPSDMVWINYEVDSLNSVVRQSATRAGFTYVDVSDAFKGHELCTPQPWINYVKTQLYSASGLVLSFSGSYHPNAKGQQAFAAKLTRSGW
jgi:hypothetical protein